jgi:hypothetical protein
MHRLKVPEASTGTAIGRERIHLSGSRSAHRTCLHVVSATAPPRPLVLQADIADVIHEAVWRSSDPSTVRETNALVSRLRLCRAHNKYGVPGTLSSCLPGSILHTAEMLPSVHPRDATISV